MIVRILGEGQLDVPDDQLDRLNELDAQVETAVETGDESRFADSLRALLRRRALCRRTPARRQPGGVRPVLPPADASLEEVRELLGDEGLIPG